jgi:sigma-54 specific flagellar transcriptional regulator A
MFRSLVGESDALQKVRYMMGQVACKEVSVLITGESGTGKEVVARNLHLNSNRSEKPFIPINCGAIPRELLESELFGHEKGAFTGAIASRAGRFELADGGTLFLDEIGDMPLSMQVKLLRVLQERSFERVGGVNTLQADVRILAATHKDLEEMIRRGEFRQDLYYRINVFPIEMPSLRERPEDIPLLLNELITIMELEKRGSIRFNSAAINSLCNYEWPGNVRELANLVERMAILYPHGIVGVENLPEKFRKYLDGNTGSPLDSIGLDASTDASVVPLQKRSVRGDATPLDSGSGLLPLSGIDLKEYLSNLEKDLIEKALSDSSGVVARAANRLQLGRTTLVEKMRKYNLQKPQESNLQASSEEGSVEGVEALEIAGKNKSASV